MLKGLATRRLALLALAGGLAGCIAGVEAEPPESAEVALVEQALTARAWAKHRHGRERLSEVGRYAEELLAQHDASEAELTVVFVLDGMHPDVINAEDTPNLYRLKQEGVSFPNSHAVFPTVTRVNSPSIATGIYPARAGIIGNSIFIPELDTTAGVNTGDWRVLRALDEVSGGRLLFVQSLAERLHAAGKTLAAVSSGSSGSAYLLNHRAEQGVGILVNGYLEDSNGRVAYPDEVDAEILARVGAPPPKSGVDGGNRAVDWTQEVLREYIIPELKPDVVLNWVTGPDGSHHSFGAGSAEGLTAIRNTDRNIGLVLDKLEELGLAEATNVFVISDHGFGVHTQRVNLVRSLVDAGLKEADQSEDVVVASNGQAAAIHVREGGARKVAAIVRHLQAQDFTGVLFTKRRRSLREHGVSVEGWVPGTFSTELVHLDNEERGADIVVTFEWSSDKNAFGVAGSDTTLTTSGTTGPISGNASGHGSMSPWTVRNTFFAWGADFKDAIVSRVPVSNVDVAPTILALAGIDPSELDGRVLAEALEGGPDYEKVPLETKSYVTQARGYRALLQVTEVGHQRYIDKSWRLD